MEVPEILSSIGGILILIYGLFEFVAGNLLTDLPITYMIGISAIGFWGIVAGFLVIISAFKYKKNKNWAVIGLVFSILGLLTFQGLFVGPILGIIGSALAMSKSKK